MDHAERTFVVYADIGCPWAHAAIYRWRSERARRGLQDDVRLDIRCFPLELFNRRATPKRILDAEIPVAGSLAPEAGWQMWQRQTYDYPVSTLPAMEAVHATKDQSLRASEDLDAALRHAMFAESRNITLHHVILDVAASCGGVDVETLDQDLRSGRARRRIFEDMDEAERSDVRGSPHFFLSNGADWHNPGVQIRWEGKEGKGFPVVEKDDPGIYADMFDRVMEQR